MIVAWAYGGIWIGNDLQAPGEANDLYATLYWLESDSEMNRNDLSKCDRLRRD